MDGIQGVAILAGLIWAGQTSITNGWKYANDVLDSVILGRIGSADISQEHAEHILRNTYIPIANGMLISGFIYAIAILAIPFLMQPQPAWLRTGIWIIGLIQIGRVLFSYRHMKNDAGFAEKAIQGRKGRGTEHPPPVLPL